MLHNGLLKLMIRSTCFGNYYAHYRELATIQMAPACKDGKIVSVENVLSCVRCAMWACVVYLVYRDGGAMALL